MAPAIIEPGPSNDFNASALAGREVDISTKSSAPIVDANHEEYQYLDLIREILDNGEHRPDR
jgi:thymidylate synthase